MGSLLLLSVTILSISVLESIGHSKQDKLSQLNSITASKKQHVENYFDDLGGMLISIANSSATGDALYYLSRFFYKIEEETKFEAKLDVMTKELKEHYAQHYVNDINFKISNVASQRNLQEYLPKNVNGILAQHVYIVKNDAPIGEKNKMDESSTLTSAYTLNHTKFHETFNTVLEQYHLYDVFLVDKKGTIVYSAYKEKDFGTNLKDGPYANSGIAQVYAKAKDLKKGEIAFVDFAPYEPSYNTPAAFIATPVFRKKRRVGSLVIQISSDVIDKMMNFNGKFEEAGLGQSGNTYLVANDYTMRNNHRFFKQIKDKKVQEAGTTIATFKINTSSVKQALQGKRGAGEILNFQGEEVLSSYDGIKIFDKQWALVSEIKTDEALDAVMSLNMILALISLAVLVVIIFIAVYVLRSLVIQPLKLFEEGLLGFFKYLNNETTTVTLLNDKRADEVGKMSAVVNENIEKIKISLDKDRELLNETVHVLSEFEQGDLCKRITKSSNNPALNELKDVLNKMGMNLESNIDNILHILEQYTNYDYLDKVNTQGLKEHLLKLANGVNSLGDATTSMLVENKTNGMKLDQSSNILLDSVSILSKNTNEAAASIEETSAALEQINSNVETNNQNVDQMSAYAQDVTQSVKDGENLANKTTVAMDEINSQVTAINDAITVIDKIAFQTNILSLNAAVEAATAGEAGKGFAVVAQEVRNLASRSAQAAKEIKDMVESANLKANEGKKIADSMIEGYGSLSGNINSTIELIESVSMASKEQQQGIAQVSNAVSQLDRQTQENAAIAQNTNSVALDTDRIAKRVVSNANAKEFHGKNEIKIEKAKEKKILKETLKSFGNDSYAQVKAQRKKRTAQYNDEQESF